MKKKSYAEKMRELKSALHYHQMYIRIDLAGINSRKQIIRRIARKMRELQRESPHK